MAAAGKHKPKTRVTVISKISDRPVLSQSCLVVIYGSELGKRFSVDRPQISIGRSARADIIIDEDSVSRNHAKITRSPRGVVVHDLGSTNGTYVNDEPVTQVTLADGDLVKIGRTIFKFLSGTNIENQYHEEVYRLTTMDGLTGIHNKRYFLDALEREVSRCRRYGRKLSLVLFDVDFFKAVNDEFGHVVGDTVLRQLALVVREKIRQEDTLARYGGEEFAVLLPETERPAALSFAEKIRRLVEKTPCHFEKRKIPVTISLGVGTLGDETAAASDLVRAADEQLYEAKAAGRNRVKG
ncbi:MAG: diguanylate cyclase [Deltaproteobacteria bacterium]|nr:diguanylate cyclase [Deltaproteobacteria bacterium]